MKKQNKRILSLVMALVMCLTLLPAAFAVEGDDLQTLINNTSENGTLTLSGDYTLTASVTINKAMTINGGGNTITITGSNKDALNITADGVTVKNLNIVTDYGNAINCTAKTLTVEGCNINTTKRGVNFTATDHPNAVLTVKNTVIKNKNVANYNTSADYGNDNRGINACDVKGGSVTIENCQILGFKYSINALVLAPNADGTGLRDGEQTTYTIKSTTVKGWTALNMWSANTRFNFNNCTLVGINALNAGGYNAFATIVANDVYGSSTDENKASVITVTGGSVTSAQLGTDVEAAFCADSTCMTEFVFVEGDGFSPVQIGIYSKDGHYVMWSFPWGTSEDMMDSYLDDKVFGLESVAVTVGTDQDYLNSLNGVQGIAAYAEDAENVLEQLRPMVVESYTGGSSL